MNAKEFNYMAKWGSAYNNRLREFYNDAERLPLLEYVIQYAMLEVEYLGKQDDQKLFEEKACIRLYTSLKLLYDACVKQLNANQPTPIISIPSKEQTLKDMKEKYEGLEKKVKEDDTGKA